MHLQFVEQLDKAANSCLYRPLRSHFCLYRCQVAFLSGRLNGRSVRPSRLFAVLAGATLFLYRKPHSQKPPVSVGGVYVLRRIASTSFLPLSSFACTQAVCCSVSYTMVVSCVWCESSYSEL